MVNDNLFYKPNADTIEATEITESGQSEDSASVVLTPQAPIDATCHEKETPTTKKAQDLPAPKKVALVHYWLVHMRGGEKVLEALCRMYPEADIYTHVVDHENLSPALKAHTIKTTFIQRLPWAKKQYQKYLPLMPIALEQLDLTDYDLVISSESGPAKGVLTRTDATHICYCHSPMRYLWDFYPQYLAAASPLIRFAMRPIFSFLRLWDVLSAQRVDTFVANAHTVRKRIQKHWRREALVVHPPVDVERFTLSEKTREDFYLCVGQLVDYKRVDIAIEACLRLQKRLVIVGGGEMRTRYENLVQTVAKSLSSQGHDVEKSIALIEFRGRMDNEIIDDLYARCAALLFPGEEDFGIVPLEAMATGCPVLAYGKGGATETVVQGKTGLFFSEQSVEALCDVMRSFEKQRDAFVPEQIREHALCFDEARFAREMFTAVQLARQKVAER